MTTALGPITGATVEIEWTAGTWTAASAYLRAELGMVGTGGRPTRYDDVAAGTWTLYLTNSDGRFTPGNSSSPYYPNVVRGKRIRVFLTAPTGTTYQRFQGHIQEYEVSFPQDEPGLCLTKISASDVLALCARRTLDAPFVEEGNARSRTAAGGSDLFPLAPTTMNVDTASPANLTQFENRGWLAAGGPATGTLKVLRSVTASAGTPGAVASSPPDASINVGSLDFTPVPNVTSGWTGPGLRYDPQAGISHVEFFLKVPPDFFIPSGLGYERCVLDMWKTGSSQLFAQVRLAMLNGQIYLGVWTGSSTLTGGADIADGAWRKITVWFNGGVFGRNKVNINDSNVFSFNSASGIDLTDCDRLYFACASNFPLADGNEYRCPQVSIAAISVYTYGSLGVGVPLGYTTGVLPSVTDASRMQSLANYLVTPALSTTVDGTAVTNVAATDTTGRTLLDCFQELGRSAAGYVYASRTGVVTLARANATYRTSSQFTITLESDDAGSAAGGADLTWRDAVDSNPTRVTATYPGGSATSINAAAETAGAFKDYTVATACYAAADASTAAAAYVGGSTALCPPQISVDLVTAETSLWAAIYQLRPGTRATVANCPSAILGVSSVDVYIDGWTETHTMDSSVFVFDTSPV